MAKKKSKPIILNLGCNRNIVPGMVNVDLQLFPGVDVATDLNYKWPWKDSTVSHIVAVDLIEHLHDPIHTMNEAWRVLKPGGIFEILVPSTDGRGAWQDPTHVSFWNENSFAYYQVMQDPNHAWVSHPWRSLYAPYLIHAAFDTIVETADHNGIIYCQARLRAVKETILTASNLPEVDDRQNRDLLIANSSSATQT